ncbi:MAG: metal-dependent hydrolase, partial [Sphingopyxis sp.]
MDNVTHSLIGAAIGQTGLKKLSGLGMPPLVISAPIPAVDAACTLYGMASLAMRRGLTHGPLAMALLPIMLVAAMVGFDRWQAARGTRPADRAPVRPLPLYLLALLGTISHPAFDWLNSYGVRLLEPFAPTWFYGDTLFIIDAALLALLIGGWFWTRRAERAGGRWAQRGRVVVALIAAYVAGNGIISARAVAWGHSAYITAYNRPADLVVASPVPLLFWRRDVLWRGGGQHGQLPYSAMGNGGAAGELAMGAQPIAMASPATAATLAAMARDDAG